MDSAAAEDRSLLRGRVVGTQVDLAGLRRGARPLLADFLHLDRLTAAFTRTRTLALPGTVGLLHGDVLVADRTVNDLGQSIAAPPPEEGHHGHHRNGAQKLGRTGQLGSRPDHGVVPVTEVLGPPPLEESQSCRGQAGEEADDEQGVSCQHHLETGTQQPGEQEGAGDDFAQVGPDDAGHRNDDERHGDHPLVEGQQLLGAEVATHFGTLDDVEAEAHAQSTQSQRQQDEPLEHAHTEPHQEDAGSQERERERTDAPADLGHPLLIRLGPEHGGEVDAGLNQREEPGHPEDLDHTDQHQGDAQVQVGHHHRLRRRLRAEDQHLHPVPHAARLRQRPDSISDHRGGEPDDEVGNAADEDRAEDEQRKPGPDRCQNPDGNGGPDTPSAIRGPLEAVGEGAHQLVVGLGLATEPVVDQLACCLVVGLAEAGPHLRILDQRGELRTQKPVDQVSVRLPFGQVLELILADHALGAVELEAGTRESGHHQDGLIAQALRPGRLGAEDTANRIQVGLVHPDVLEVRNGLIFRQGVAEAHSGHGNLTRIASGTFSPHLGLAVLLPVAEPPKPLVPVVAHVRDTVGLVQPDNLPVVAHARHENATGDVVTGEHPIERARPIFGGLARIVGDLVDPVLDQIRDRIGCTDGSRGKGSHEGARAGSEGRVVPSKEVVTPVATTHGRCDGGTQQVRRVGDARDGPSQHLRTPLDATIVHDVGQAAQKSRASTLATALRIAEPTAQALAHGALHRLVQQLLCESFGTHSDSCARALGLATCVFGFLKQRNATTKPPEVTPRQPDFAKKPSLTRAKAAHRRRLVYTIFWRKSQ